MTQRADIDANLMPSALCDDLDVVLAGLNSNWLHVG